MDNIDPCRMLDMYSLLNKKSIHEKGRVGRAERWRKGREEKKGKRNEPLSGIYYVKFFHVSINYVI